MFNKIVKKYISLIESASVKQISKAMFDEKMIREKNGLSSKMAPLDQSLEDELEEASQKVKKQEMEEKKKLIGIDWKQYEIKGSEKEWTDVLKLPAQSSYVTIKRYISTFKLSISYLSRYFEYSNLYMKYSKFN